jgi:hypothetical protein
METRTPVKALTEAAVIPVTKSVAGSRLTLLGALKQAL